MQRTDASLAQLIQNSFSLSSSQKAAWVARLSQLSKSERNDLHFILEQDQISSSEKIWAANHPQNLVDAQKILRERGRDLATVEGNRLLERSILLYEQLKDVSALKDLLEAFLVLEAEGVSFDEKTRSLIRRLRFQILNTVDPATVAELIRTASLWALREEIDLKGKVKDFLEIAHDDLTGWERRRQVTGALHENVERIGPGVLSAPGTVALWLKLYDRIVGSERHRGSLERSRFLSESREAQTLSTEDRALLTKLLEFYDFLRFEPSDEFIEDFVRQGGAWDSQGEPIVRESKAGRAVGQESAQTNQNNSATLLNRLQSQADAGKLEAMLDDPVIKKELTFYLESGKRSLPASHTALVAMALRVTLERLCRMGSSEAAQIAVELANRSARAGKPEYLEMAYFDETTKTFRWKE